MRQERVPFNVAIERYWPALCGVPLFCLLTFVVRAPTSLTVVAGVLFTAPAFWVSARRSAPWSFWVFSLLLLMPVLLFERLHGLQGPTGWQYPTSDKRVDVHLLARAGLCEVGLDRMVCKDVVPYLRDRPDLIRGKKIAVVRGVCSGVSSEQQLKVFNDLSTAGLEVALLETLGQEEDC